MAAKSILWVVSFEKKVSKIFSSSGLSSCAIFVIFPIPNPPLYRLPPRLTISPVKSPKTDSSSGLDRFPSLLVSYSRTKLSSSSYSKLRRKNPSRHKLYIHHKKRSIIYLYLSFKLENLFSSEPPISNSSASLSISSCCNLTCCRILLLIDAERNCDNTNSNNNHKNLRKARN
jgi:hypothetical protein